MSPADRALRAADMVTAWKIQEMDAETVAKSLQDVGMDNPDDRIELSRDEADFATYLQTELGVKKCHANKIMKSKRISAFNATDPTFVEVTRAAEDVKEALYATKSTADVNAQWCTHRSTAR